jgi:hypothetical protein
VNGIHEVTGSIPVWSTNLRSRVPTSVSYGWQAKRRLPTEARSAKVGLLAVAAQRGGLKTSHPMVVPSSCDSSRNRLAIAATPSVDSLISVR